MEKENSNGGKYSGFFSKKLRAGKRRTYFFDVRSTKQGDFFLTITESKKRFEGDGYDSHKIFLYKEDFKKFLEALNETVDYIKSDLMPDYDYNADRAVHASGENHSSDNEQQHDHEPERKEVAAKAPVASVISDSVVTTPTNHQISDDEQMDWN